MSNSAEKVAEHRQRRRKLLVQILGGKCALCGYSRCSASLEFHHIDPDNKKYQLSSGNCHELERDLEEAKKCILVCANCHREIHNSHLYDNYNLWDYQFYDYDLAKRALEEKVNKDTDNNIRYCSKCGALITRFSKTGLCAKCCHKRSRKVERPSREELKKMIRSAPFEKIGRIYGCTGSAIKKWCKAYKLPHCKKVIDNFTDDEWTLV